MHIPELLAPAGGMPQLKTAVRYGANAVYLGLTRYGLRAHAGNFTPEQLREAVEYAHARGVKVYVTLNIFAYEEDVPAMVEAARLAQETSADGVIMADPGAVDEVLHRVPGLPVHLSTQANTMNSASARFWHRCGVERIVLARELSLAQIKALRENTPGSLELEVFVHGAVCMAYSGRCALSRYLSGRDANRGDCAQPCRWKYTLEEEKRPGLHLPIEDVEGGTRILSACDMNLVRLLPALCEAGVDSLKIEGRMKNEYYIATVVGAYRRGLDALAEGRFTPELADALDAELRTISHRPYDTGFLLGRPQFPGDDALKQTRELAARVLEWEGGEALVQMKNKLIVGDALELLTPEGVFPFTLTEIRTEVGERVPECGRPDSILRIPLPHPAQPGDLLRGLCRNHPAAPEDRL